MLAASASLCMRLVCDTRALGGRRILPRRSALRPRASQSTSIQSGCQMMRRCAHRSHNEPVASLVWQQSSGNSDGPRAGRHVLRSGSRHVCCSRKPCGETAQTTHAGPACLPGQCVKRPIAPALIGWPCCLHSPREEPKWLIPHPSRSRSTADCRPLLQQSLPNRGQVVQPGKRAAPTAGFHLVRLTDRHSICTAAGALSGEPTAHTWNVRPQAPTPAASYHCYWNVH